MVIPIPLATEIKRACLNNPSSLTLCRHHLLTCIQIGVYGQPSEQYLRTAKQPPATKSHACMHEITVVIAKNRIGWCPCQTVRIISGTQIQPGCCSHPRKSPSQRNRQPRAKHQIPIEPAETHCLKHRDFVHGRFSDASNISPPSQTPMQWRPTNLHQGGSGSRVVARTVHNRTDWHPWPEIDPGLIWASRSRGGKPPLTHPPRRCSTAWTSQRKQNGKPFPVNKQRNRSNRVLPKPANSKCY